MQKMKTILKFDTGADGFKRMCIVLGICAVALLIIGGLFLITLMNDLKSLS